jgi:ABC-type antimicrobial peptide transport system permease subunit
LWILARSARLATVAFLAGLLLVFVAGRTMEALLFGASARDPAALGVAVAAFVTITLIAVVAPAIRAMRVEPARVLRLD